jgi:hypothetical protein
MTPAPTSLIDKHAQLRQWKSNGEKVQRFRILLADPVIQEALRLVQLAGIPTIRRSHSGSAELLTLSLALDQARQEGWHAAILAFDGLKNLETPKTQTSQQEWEHVGAPEENQEQ